MTRLIAALVAFAVLAAPAGAWAADAANGKKLAERWCAACHIVSPQQRNGTTQAPPFSEIAKRPHIDAPMVAFFLMNPHPRMPDMSLTRTEAADLAAYIVSLK
ncbi:MAG TPA: cytochrome c [Pseudolabrys sp.]|nr:cytochrome c [Pseudolabrys sp.]